jgi:hypothetical protein
MSKKYYECVKEASGVCKDKIKKLNGGQFVWGRIKGGDMICCWLTP